MGTIHVSFPAGFVNRDMVHCKSMTLIIVVRTAYKPCSS